MISNNFDDCVFNEYSNKYFEYVRTHVKRCIESNEFILINLFSCFDIINVRSKSQAKIE